VKLIGTDIGSNRLISGVIDWLNCKLERRHYFCYSHKTHTHTLGHIHTLACAHKLTHALINSHTHTQTLSLPHTHSHTHTHRHTHKGSNSFRACLRLYGRLSDILRHTKVAGKPHTLCHGITTVGYRLASTWGTVRVTALLRFTEMDVARCDTGM
jgi:hypothetical protein